MPVRRICDNCHHFGLIMDCWACKKHKRLVSDHDTCDDWKMKAPTHHPGCGCSYCQEYYAQMGAI